MAASAKSFWAFATALQPPKSKELSIHRIFLCALSLLLGCSAPAATTAGGTTGIDVATYDLAIEILPESHMLMVAGNIVLPASRVERTSVQLALSDSASAVEWVDRGDRLQSMRARPIGPEDGETVWKLEGKWPAGKAIDLGFRYKLVTPEPKGFLYIGPEIAFGAGGWYPSLEGAPATGTLRIQSRSEGVFTAIGRSAGARRERGVTSQEFAAATPGQLVFVLSPKGAESRGLSSSLALTTLKRRANEGTWGRGLAGVSQALQAEFGPLPHDHVTVIEVPDAIAEKAGFGAFATTGAVLARTSFFDQPFNVAAFAHEFSHLWWGNHIQLAGKQGDFLLDEGLAQYGSMVAVDRVLGVAAGARYRREGWPGFNEALFSGLGYLKISVTEFDRPLLELPDDGLSYWIAYSKAGLAWYALAQEIGPANFSRALKEIAAEHGAATVSWSQFLEGLRRRSGGRDVTFFATAWFGKAGAPDYALEWRQTSAAVVGRVTQSGALKPATLELAITGEDAKVKRHLIRVAGPATSFKIPTGGRTASVELDPDYKVLRWTTRLREEATIAAPYMRASILARLGKKEEAERALLAVVRQGDQRHDVLLLAHASLVRLSEDRGCPACATKHLQAALAIAPTHLNRLALTYLSLALAGRRLGKAELADRAAAFALSADALAGHANGVSAKLAPPAR